MCWICPALRPEVFPGGLVGKESAFSVEDEDSMPGLGGSPAGGHMAAQSSILAWRIPWTEEPGGLQSTGLQGVGHDWATKHTSCPPGAVPSSKSWHPSRICVHFCNTECLQIVVHFVGFFVFFFIYFFLFVVNFVIHWNETKSLGLF